MGILEDIMGPRPNPTGMTPQEQVQKVAGSRMMPAPITRGTPSFIASRDAVPPQMAPPAPDKPSFGQKISNFFSDEDKVAKLILALEPLRGPGSQGGTAAKWAQGHLQTSQATNLLKSQGNRTAEALERAGQQELADLVRANPGLAKTAITALTRNPSAFEQKVSALVDSGVPRADAVKQVISSGGTTVNMPSVGTIPPGYRAAYDEAGNVTSMEPIPGGPVASEEGEQSQTAEQAYAAYQAGIGKMFEAFGAANTGSLMGLLPALTSGDLTFEGLQDVMLQPLKSIFRGKGEGTFTDDDAKQLLRMLPTRRDTEESARAKIDAADMIIRAKLGLPLSLDSTGSTQPKPNKVFNEQTGQIEDIN